MDIRAHCESIGIELHGAEAWNRMVDQVRKICEEYHLAACAEALLVDGLDELFHKDGSMMEYAMMQAIEKGKRWAFGDKGKEATWAAHAGD